MVIKVHKLNHEEQEKLASIGHFWDSWGGMLTAVLVAALLAFAGWRGYLWYQTSQAVKASALYDQVMADAQSGDTAKLAASLKMMEGSYGSTAYAQQAGMLAAKVFYEKGQAEQSRAALAAVANTTADKGLQSAAKLQLAGILLEQKKYDEAIKQLNSVEPAYETLAADRLGDAYALQNNSAQAIAAYTQAYKGLEANQPYRQMVALKLSGLGVDAATLVAAAAPTNASSAPASSAAVAASAPASGK